MNRTKMAMKSTFISLFIFVIQGVLLFWRTSVIINVYGVNINSVIQASGDVFSYLILMESGLGAAYLFKMYKPVTNNNLEKVYSLYKGLSRKLKRVGLYMIGILIVIAMVYPYFLGENDIPYFKSTMIILILGLRSALPYYFTIARKNLIKAEEKQYVVTFVDGIISSLILFGEIALALWLNARIEVALSIGILVILASNYVYKKLVVKKYGEFEKKEIEPSYEGDEMTNDIIVHQIASLANSHIDVFILSLIDLPAVTVYSAYNTAISYPTRLVSKIVENIRASIGLKLNAEDRNVYPVFRELLSLNYYVAVVIIPVFILFINEFITLWIGAEFLLGVFSIIMFALLLFHKLTVNLLYIVRDGRGLYKESKGYTIVTAVSNIVLSIILANLYSINGLLLATLSTNFLIMDYGNLKLVYNHIFDRSHWIVLKDYLGLISIVVVSTLISSQLLNIPFLNQSETWVFFVIKVGLSAGISAVTATLLMLLYHPSFRRVFNRIVSYFKK